MSLIFSIPFHFFPLQSIPLILNGRGLSTMHGSGSWHDALAFGLSVAVGLTPQMMPMILTANLVRGARLLRDKHCVVRNLSAVQNLGAMDVLCCDKTGTLTEDNVRFQPLSLSVQDSFLGFRFGILEFHHCSPPAFQ